MPSKREEREKLRAQRLAAQGRSGTSQRLRLIGGYALAGLLSVAVIAGLVAVITSDDPNGPPKADCDEAHVAADFGSFQGLDFDCREGTEPPPITQGDLALAADEAGCNLREDLPNEGQTHVEDSTEVQYATTPPASGNHHPEPAADGAYLTPVRVDPEGSGNEMTERNFIHSLEHGRVVIQYSPDLPEDDQLALKGVFDSSPGGMILYPNAEMPAEVAVTAWRQLLTCPAYNERVLGAIQVFRDVYRGRGPENIPLMAA